MTDTPSPGPLAGLRVVDVGRLVAGPFAATLLGELGADVVKVEPVGVGDPLRSVGTIIEPGMSCAWIVEGRNKRSVALDLRDARGRELLLGLIASADILVENSRPGWLESIGLTTEVLNETRPALIVARVSGYGQGGPYRHKPGLDRQAVAISGVAGLTGLADGPPIKPGVFVADYTTGLYAAFLILSALRARDGGRATLQVIDLGLYEFALRMTGDWLPEFSHTGMHRQRTGNGSDVVAPSGAFESSDGIWMMIACSTDDAWGRLCELIGMSDSACAELAWGPARVERRHEVNDAVAQWVATRPAATIEERFDEANLPISRFYDAADVLADPHFHDRGSLTTALIGAAEIAVPAPAGRMPATPGGIRWHGAPLGFHTSEVLENWLAVDAATVADLVRDGVVGVAPHEVGHPAT